MGCDIHMYAEVRSKDTRNWEKAGKVFPNPYYRPEEPNRIDEDGYEWNGQYTDQPYRGRNYDLFAMLADVRNGRGFAGIKTGEGFNPIAEPKDLPEDMSDAIRELSEEWDCDGHSHSWLTVQELLDYDWDQITMHRGTITLEQYKSLKETGGSPNSWCGSVWGGDTITIDEDVADRVLSGEMERPAGTIYVNYHWASPYRESAGHFLEGTLPLLQALGDPQDVRIVFWFDN